MLADEAPGADTITGYDEEHLMTYRGLLDAECEGAEWDSFSSLYRSHTRARTSTPGVGDPSSTREMAARARVRSTFMTARRTEVRSASNGGFKLCGFPIFCDDQNRRSSEVNCPRDPSY